VDHCRWPLRAQTPPQPCSSTGFKYYNGSSRRGFQHARRVLSLICFCPQGHSALPHDRRGVGPGEAQALYETLPSSFHASLAGISPATYVQDIGARLLVMHDRDDLLVPAAESRPGRGTPHGALGIRPHHAQRRGTPDGSRPGSATLPPHVRNHPYRPLMGPECLRHQNADRLGQHARPAVASSTLPSGAGKLHVNRYGNWPSLHGDVTRLP
jgi:hypothetical protein